MTRPLTSYAAGYSCGKNGPNMVNCHFSLFGTKEKTRDWERGKRDAEQEPSPWFPARIKPVHVGMYEVAYSTRFERYWWTGKYWTTHKGGLEIIWPLPEAWRGLARKP